MILEEWHTEKAKEQILEILKEGPCFENQIFIILEAEGFKERTIRRAIEELRKRKVIDSPRITEAKVIKIKIKPKDPKGKPP